MCGIIGIAANEQVNQLIYDAITVLQHRGQDAAGITTCDNGKLFIHKNKGLVKDVFHTRHMRDLKGTMGIGHVRYPTAGNDSSVEEAQPFFVNSPYGISLAHNGNLVNASDLKQELFVEDRRHINTDSDSEVLLNVFANELQKHGQLTLSKDDLFNAVEGVYKRCIGGYAAVAMITGYGVVGFRDPNGIRPLVVGYRDEHDGQRSYMLASESVALDVLGFKLLRDVLPNEVVFITKDGEMHSKQFTNNSTSNPHTPCIFEFVYFARPDSIMDDVYVYKARLRMGELLARKILAETPNHDIDVVIPIPDTSRTSAIPLAYALDVKYREGFIKNRYIGRTFIMPGQKMRKKSVRHKLNPIPLEFKGKNVLLVDDSIVRGTTSALIIEMAREAGANKVYFASASPPVRYPNIYGIDMPNADELIAHGCTTKEVCKMIGADRLYYQDLDDLITSVQQGNPDIKKFDTSVFNNEYIAGSVDNSYFDKLAKKRNDSAKEQRRNE